MRSHLLSGLLVLSLCGCQAEADDHLVDSFGKDGDQNFTFIKPRRLMPGTDGMLLVGNDLWVALSLNEAVVVLDSRTGAIKRFVASESDPDDKELVAPDDLWRDPLTGDVYVSQVGDGTGGHVDKIAANGTRTRILTRFADNNAFPNGITGLHRQGEPVHIYISPVNFFGGKTGIYEVDVTGANRPTLIYGAQNGVDTIGVGLPGGGNGMEFDKDGRELFTPVTFGGAVLAIDVVNKTARTVWNGNGGTSRGVYVRFSADKRSLLFTEHSTGKILRLDPNGPPDQVPTLVAQLDIGIDGLAVAPDGRVFISNFITGGVALMKTTGEIQQLFTRSMNIPNGVAELPDGRLVLGDTPSLAVVDPELPASELPFRPKFFIDGDITQGVAASGACDIFVTTYFRRNIQHYDLCAAIFNRSTNITALFSMGLPNDLVLVGDTLFASDAAGLVWRLTVSGAATTTASPFATGMAKPSGIAHRDGKLFVSEFNANRVRVLDAATGATLSTITNVDTPEGLAVESDGSILVVESTPGRLTRISPDGSRKTLATGLGTKIKGLLHPFVNLYSDVLLQDDGDVIVTEPLTGAVREFDL